MEGELTLQNIKNKVIRAYTSPDRITELEECLKLCDELIEIKCIEYDNLSYISQFWYFMYPDNDIYELKSVIGDCIINEQFKPYW
jgi:hypothetical protein